MAFSTYIGLTPVSVPLDSTPVNKFLRVKQGSNGLFTVQDATARGSFVTLNDGAASEVVEGGALNNTTRVPIQCVLASAIAPGTTAYAVAGGCVGDSNASGVIVGTFHEAATASGQTPAVDIEAVL